MKTVDKLKKLILLIFAFYVCGNTTFAATDQDAETLWGAEITKKFKKSLELSLEEELRTKDFINEIDRLSTSFGVTYNHPDFKDLKVSVNYNFLNYFENNYIEENRHRVSAHLQYKYSFGGFDFSLRTRFQATFRDETLGNYKVNPKYIWKNRIGVAYKIYGTPYEPYFNLEVSNPVAHPDENQINRLRYKLGCEYRVNKKNALDLFVRYTQDINQKEPMNSIGVGIGYRFKL